MVFNTGPYTVLADNSILVTANMQPETGFPSSPSHQLKSYVAFKSRLKLAARAVLSADAGLLVFTQINPAHDTNTMTTHYTVLLPGTADSHSLRPRRPSDSQCLQLHF